MSARFGGHTSTGSLKRVFVRPPRVAHFVRWHAYGWKAEPDARGLRREHEALCIELQRAGAEVLSSETVVPEDPDAIYVYDPAFVVDEGVIVLRPGKEGRRGEPDLVADDLAKLGIPVVARMQPPATLEGGDMFWLDDTTLVVGRGFRTNDDGIDFLRSTFGGRAQVVTFDLPHLQGPNECLHLMSLISPLDADLCVAYLPLLPVRLVELLGSRGIQIVPIPEEEFEGMAPNVLALAPRVALALDGNVRTRRRLEQAGVDVRVYPGENVSLKGGGGPTCLTRPILRGVAGRVTLDRANMSS